MSDTLKDRVSPGQPRPGAGARPRYARAACSLALVLALWPGAAGARQRLQEPRPAPAEADQAEGAAVVLSGERIFDVSTGVGPFSARERAARISARLEVILTDRTIPDPRVTVSEVENTSQLTVGPHPVMTVTEVDAEAIGVARRQVAAAYALEIETALRAERARRTPEALLDATIKASVATAVFLLVLWSTIRLWRWLHRRIHAWRLRRFGALRIRRVELVSADRLSQYLHHFQRVSRVVVILVLIDVYLTYVLGLFPWTRMTSVALLDYAVAPVRAGWAAFTGYLPNLFFLLFIALVFYYVTRLVGIFFDAIGQGRIVFAQFPAEWADPTNKIVRALLIAFALVMAFPYLPGSASPAFTGISVLAGVLLSLASSSSLSNMIAGLVLTYTGAFRIGDRVRIGDAFGDIVERSLLVTRVRTIKNEDVTIPNGIVLGSQVTNYSRGAQGHGLILHTSVTIGYDAPWRQIHDLLAQAALATPGILATPPPFVWQTALNDFYVTYEINAYTDAPQEAPATYAALHANIQDAFYAAGVEIMSPHFAAIRDGNAMAVPHDKWPVTYEPSRFRVDTKTRG